MAAFHNPLDPPPRPGQRYDPGRERAHQSHSAEAANRIGRIEAQLAPYLPTQIVLADGSRYEVLARPSGSGAVSAGAHPFKVLSAGATTPEDEEEAPQPQVSVYVDSQLSTSLRMASGLAITGLETLRTVAVDDLIWLEVAFTDGAPSTAAIEHGPQWDGYDSPVEWDDPEADNRLQTKLRVLLAYVVTPPGDGDADEHPGALTVSAGGTALRVIQCVSTHLRLCAMCFEGDDNDPATAVFAVPWFAPGPAPVDVSEEPEDP